MIALIPVSAVETEELHVHSALLELATATNSVKMCAEHGGWDD
jgi:hypothetical protein